MILNGFLPKYVHINGLKISGALGEFSITSRFLGSKMQKINFLRKYGFNGDLVYKFKRIVGKSNFSDQLKM